jgi:beta-lactamase regulating signal transducer with metallopeptidase domain
MSPVAVNAEFQHRVVLLGWTLVNSVWELSVVGVIFALLMLALRRPAARYMTATICICACAIIPVATFLWLRAIPPSRVAADLPLSVPAALTTMKESRPHAVFTHLPQISLPSLPSMVVKASLTERIEHEIPFLVGLWLAGFLLMCVRIGGGLVLIERRRRSARAGEPAWQERLKGLAHRCGIAHRVQIRFSDVLDSPVVLGVFRATILFPSGLLTGLSVEHLEALLAHELAHIKRYDFLVNLLQSAVEAALFFHPVVWWISSQMRKEREFCCDDFAVRALGNPVGYAGALASLESLRLTAPRLAIPANGGRLMYRVQRIISSTQPSAVAGFAWLPLLAALAITGGAAGTIAVVKPELIKKPVAMIRHIIAAAKSAAVKPAGVSSVPDDETACLFVPYSSHRAAQASQPKQSLKPPAVTGKVVSSEGRPVADALVVVAISPTNPRNIYTGKSDDKGTFDILTHLKPEEHVATIYAFKRGEGVGRIGVDGTLQRLQVRLAPPTELKVKIVDPDGKPLGGVPTQPDMFWDHYSSGGSLTFDFPDAIANQMVATSNTNGIATIKDLPQGEIVRLAVESERFEKIGPDQDIDLLPGKSTDGVLIVHPAGLITGRLLRNGVGVSGQQIQAYGAGDNGGQVWTDFNGVFRIPGLAPGTYAVFAQLRPEVCADWVAQGVKATVKPGDVVKDIELNLVSGSRGLGAYDRLRRKADTEGRRHGLIARRSLDSIG